MSSKQNIILHLDGISACESKEFDHARKIFMRITEPSAAIYYNMGHCNLKLKRYSDALEMFQQCVDRDKYLAIGHFQLGLAQTLCGDLTSAVLSFQGALSTLRGNSFIDYKQLNMSCKLYACEINFNLSLVYLFSGDYDTAKDYLHAAADLPTDSSRHFAIPEAVDATKKRKWEYFGQDVSERLMMVPENSFFRVSKAKMEGLQTSTKFMDQAKVVAAVNDEYSFVGFVGAKKLQSGNIPPQNVSSPKRSNPPMGPPPSVPPPRLPSSLSPPSPSLPVPTALKPSGVSSGKTSPTRKPSPSRPPPPSAPPPKPSAKPTPRDTSPIKPQGRRSPGGGGNNVMSELRKTMENVKFKPSNSSPRSATNDVGNPSSPSHTPKKKQEVTLKCDFKLEVESDISYDDLLAKLSEKLYQASSDLCSPLQRKSLILTLEDQNKKTKVAVTSDNPIWHTTWSNVTKNRQSDPLFVLKEFDKEVPDKYSRQRIQPTPQRYEPSRPVPFLNNKGTELGQDEEEDEEGIYHDIS